MRLPRVWRRARPAALVLAVLACAELAARGAADGFGMSAGWRVETAAAGGGDRLPV